MKSNFALVVLELCIAKGIFGDEYWRTRNLSGNDYGIEYNVNSTKFSDAVRGELRPRTLFNWYASPAKKVNRTSIPDFESKMMASEISGERDQSNIWWPWSNYEEWARARAQTGFHLSPNYKKFAVPQSTTSLFVVETSLTQATPPSRVKPAEEKKHRKKGKKRRHRKRKKNRDHTTMTTTMTNVIPEVANEIPREVPSTRMNEKDFSNSIATFPGSTDNNEMDNDIHPSYNSYNSVPVLDAKNSLKFRVKKNQSLTKYIKEYSPRNFTRDINECLVDNGGCEGLCINTPGSYKCHCPDGFRVEGTKCIDINECLLRNGHGPCQDKCVNQWGSYRCSCDDIPGTRLAADSHTCEDIDECKEQTAGCSHECINTVGSAFCLCPSGYMLGLDWKTCHDIDECLMEEMQETRCEHRCENTEGSYKCLD